MTHDTPFDIICLSHLTWETTLFQRPQQIMLRLSERHRVVYVSHIGTRRFLRDILRGNWSACVGRPNPNLTYINIPYLPFTKYLPPLRWAKHYLWVLAARFLAWRRGMKNVCLWLYYPGFFPFRRGIGHERLVYDCMDQFQAFEIEDPRIGETERDLLEAADVVFTGGRSLQRDKEAMRPDAVCFPSGVDVEHFGKATLDATPVPNDIASLPRPILGYFGAIDERIDFDLVNYLCETHPDWSVVFLGPLVQYHTPPVQQPNFHYLGPKPYAELPGYLRAFDVCLMPFVDSDLTRHISPTKTPEYLAGGKPVVSTPVPDVIADYGDVVRVESDYEAFAAAVTEALASVGPDQRDALRNRAAAQSWKAIVAEMEKRVAP
jgi:UDP-galactopyranose mutase